MNTNEHEYLDSLVRVVIGAAYTVSNAIGNGFLEKVYERALKIELLAQGLQVRSQAGYNVVCRGQNVGTYFANLLVDERLVVEIKCVSTLMNQHLAQCLNYLRASGLRIALLVNFQNSKVEWKRIII